MSDILVESFFDDNTNTVTYLIIDEHSKECAIVDPVLELNLANGQLTTSNADNVATHISNHGYDCKWILETHIHADHVSAANYLREKLGAKVAISKYITTVYDAFQNTFNLDNDYEPLAVFDLLLDNEDTLELGTSTIQIIGTPGHTPACLTYYVGNALFVGDTLFMPDFGSARCDFPNGSAATLYQSIQQLFALPDETLVYVGHDYKAPGRDQFAWQTTIGEQKAKNIHFANKEAQSFIAQREERDRQLSVPKLMHPAIQLNLFAGQLPAQSGNGRHFMKYINPA